MSGNALVAMMHPKVIESFRNWMIIEWRGQRQNRKVAEDNNHCDEGWNFEIVRIVIKLNVMITNIDVYSCYSCY